MNKKYILWTSCFLAILLTLFVIVNEFYFDLYRYKVVKSKTISGISFDSRSQDKSKSSVKEFNESVSSKLKEISISFEIKTNSMSGSSNIFHTGPLNSGIRLEASTPSKLVLIIPGRQMPYSGINNENTRNIVFAEFLKFKKWYAISITVDRSGHLKAYLDGKCLIDETVDDFDISDIAVGTPNFDGSIKNFYLKYELLKKNIIIDILNAICILLATVLGIIAFIYLIPKIYHLRLLQILSNKKSYSYTLFTFFIFCLVFLFSYPKPIYENILKSENISGIFYDSRSNHAGHSDIKEFKELLSSPLKEVDIRFDMKVNSMSGSGNVMQTGPLNSGIRLETSKPSRLTLFIGSPKGVKTFVITESLRIGKWYSVRIHLDKQNDLSVYLDNSRVVDINPEIDYVISDIAIGTGYSKMRNFDGSISNLSFQYALFAENNILKITPKVFTIILGLLSIVISLLWIKTFDEGLRNKKRIDQIYTWFYKSGKKSITWLKENRDLSSPVKCFAIIVLCCVIYFLLLPYEDAFHYKVVINKTFGNKDRITQSNIKEFSDSSSSGLKEVDISFQMKAHSIYGSSNAFQTGPLDSGIRLEISAPSKLTLFIPSRAGIRSFVVTNALKLNSWYSIRIKIKKNNDLSVYLNNDLVTSTNITKINYVVSDIIVGAGYKKPRVFDGSITNLQAEYRLLNVNRVTWFLFHSIQFILKLTILCFLPLLVIAIYRNNHKILKKSFNIIIRIKIWVEKQSELCTTARCLVIIMLCIVILFPLSFYRAKFMYKLIKDVKISGISFDSQSSNKLDSTVKEFTEIASSRFKEIDIHFQMKVNSISGFGNVFQTGPSNTGIRLEVSGQSRLALLIGSAGGIKAFILTESLQINKWYSVRIAIDKYKNLTGYVNNKCVFNVLNADLDYKISNIAVGAGYSKIRQLKGSIANFEIRYKLLNTSIISKLCLLGEILVLLILSLFIILLLWKKVDCLDHDKKIKTSLRIFYIGLFTGSIIEYIYYFTNKYFYKLTYPFTSPLFVPEDRFMDFFNINLRAVSGARYTDLGSICPPFGLLVSRYFSFFADYNHGSLDARLQAGATISLFLYIAIYACFLVLLSKKTISKAIGTSESGFDRDSIGLFITLLISYPVIFAIDRGNYIMYASICLYFFLYSKDQNGWFAAFCLAAAISFKAHLAIYLIAFLDRSNFNKIVKIVVSFLVLNIVSSIFLQDFNFFTMFLKNYLGFSNVFSNPFEIVFNSSSLYTIIYMGSVFLMPRIADYMLYIYSPLSILGILALGLVILAKVKDLNMRLFYITIFIILFPVASFDYNLILLIIFLPHLLPKLNEEFRYSQLFLLLLALVPKHYFTIHLASFYITQIPLGFAYLRLTEQIILTPIFLFCIFLIPLFGNRVHRTENIKIH